ncbi:MAG: 3-deoxy-8-phosphooctulonate synthase [Candidatus Schekmanbacteria bacterium]|nr:3-deoxy-8-phosphooctulonate synthase [Candidatus Schekmanbacteria bacterium]
MGGPGADHVEIGDGRRLAFIAGPCVLEGRDFALSAARSLRKIAESLHIPLVFKASFDKANRTRVDSYRGPGLEAGLRILDAVRKETGLPVVTDIHEPAQADKAAAVVDLLQIPAFLCRQTDLLLAATRTGKPVLVKKGQFLAPDDMSHIVQKAKSSGGGAILVAERGTMLGYHDLVVDMRSLVIMRQCACPVVYDCTHSVQIPGGAAGVSSGRREFVAPLARAAVAVGCDAVFCETHPDPACALSDAGSQMRLEDFEPFAGELSELAAYCRASAWVPRS